MVHPHTIDQHTGCQRIALARDGLRQLKTATAILERRPIWPREHLQKMARDDFTWILGMPAD